jgi:2,3-bisphosphoglycerate-independent phosphoglycerate mutase
LSLRCNLVTLSGGGRYEDLSMADYSAGEIGTGEARELVLALQENFGDLTFSFHAGVSYRHCLVWKGARGSPGVGLGLTPPHDISLKRIRDWLPGGEACAPLARMMRESRELLSAHPVNAARRARGESEANSIWLWGEGFRPALPSFRALHGIGGSVISAVDLVKGIGICALMRSVEVEGATGNLHSNFAGKAAAALRELESGVDFVYLHVEAPDECGHRHDIEGKVRAIELIDGEIVGPLVAGLERLGDWRVLVLPDHPTPLSLRTHTAEPVPFLACGRGIPASGRDRYDEATAAETGLFVERGHELLGRFLRTED